MRLVTCSPRAGSVGQGSPRHRLKSTLRGAEDRAEAPSHPRKGLASPGPSVPAPPGGPSPLNLGAEAGRARHWGWLCWGQLAGDSLFSAPSGPDPRLLNTAGGGVLRGVSVRGVWVRAGVSVLFSARLALPGSLLGWETCLPGSRGDPRGLLLKGESDPWGVGRGSRPPPLSPRQALTAGVGLGSWAPTPSTQPRTPLIHSVSGVPLPPWQVVGALTGGNGGRL